MRSPKKGSQNDPETDLALITLSNILPVAARPLVHEGLDEREDAGVIVCGREVEVEVAVADVAVPDASDHLR